MVSETTAMVLAKGHNPRWPLTSLGTVGGPGRPHGRGVDDRIRQAAQTIYQALIEAELTQVIGAGPHERTPERSAQRNGHRSRVLATTAGIWSCASPSCAPGRSSPALLERRRRVDQALVAVVMEAYLHGVSTRKVDDLVRALGADSGISKSEVSRICADLDGEVSAFRDRSLAGQRFPYVLVDATSCKARVNRRVVAQAVVVVVVVVVVVATGVCGDGRREVLGLAVGDSQDGAFWTAFLRSLKARGLAGVQLVIADAHSGWARPSPRSWPAPPSSAAGSISCVTCSPRSQGLLGDGRRGHPHIFAPPDAAHVQEQLRTIAGMLGRQFPKLHGPAHRDHHRVTPAQLMPRHRLPPLTRTTALTPRRGTSPKPLTPCEHQSTALSHHR
jgi:putative transposase